MTIKSKVYRLAAKAAMLTPWLRTALLRGKDPPTKLVPTGADLLDSRLLDRD
jgi:hypothetical protein